MKLIKRLHKWLSFLVALQLLIWLGSGLFFNLMDHNEARGNKYKVDIANVSVIEHARLLEPSIIIGNNKLKPLTKPIHSLKLIRLLGQPYYLLNHHKGLYKHFYNEHSLIHAYTGEVKVIDTGMAQAIASRSYNGNIKILSSKKITPPFDDFPKEKNSVWQVNFEDELKTSVYIDASSGRLVGHSNEDKRFAEFFFMLHFMDYGTVGGFNNWQIIFFALFTLLFSMTGFIWMIELIKKGRYKRR
jgi:hypothetical protein